MKILVRPLCAESLGVRSTATYVETPDLKLLIDAGCALAPRFGQVPHPLEYRALERARKIIREHAERCEAIVVSHYHFDHFSPFFEETDTVWTWSDQNVAREIYYDKIIYIKDFERNINFSQKVRGRLFNKAALGIAKKIIKADEKNFYYGGTTLQFSKPLFHGEENSKLGYVLATIIRSRDLTFIHTSDIQGAISDYTFRFILEECPDILVIGGPPTYLNSFEEKNYIIAKSNLLKLVEETKLMIIDHHILRDIKAIAFIENLKNRAKEFKHQVRTFAEFQGKDNQLLEAKRMELYSKDEPSKEFIHWANLPAEIRGRKFPPL
ncbi:MAG: MBL fold metallo-hydrolase [Nitrososphaeria archaeon]|nr:MBL fold metallo-hydrolase [Nitrososphaeria archaeon]